MSPPSSSAGPDPAFNADARGRGSARQRAHCHTSLCACKRSMKTQTPNQLYTSCAHMTFRGYRTVRTFRSMKNGNPVDNQVPPNHHSFVASEEKQT
jgi:hypothetical protein